MVFCGAGGSVEKTFLVGWVEREEMTIGAAVVDSADDVVVLNWSAVVENDRPSWLFRRRGTGEASEGVGVVWECKWSECCLVEAKLRELVLRFKGCFCNDLVPLEDVGLVFCINPRCGWEFGRSGGGGEVWVVAWLWIKTEAKSWSVALMGIEPVSECWMIATKMQGGIRDRESLRLRF